MRICIFSHPRTGSTFLHNYLVNFYDCIGYREIFANDTVVNDEKYKLLNAENYVVKFMAHHFLIYDFDKIPWFKFDKIYITERKNLADSCASQYVMISMDKNNQQPEPFTIKNDWFIDWIKNYKLFQELKIKLTKNYKITENLYYEDIISSEKFLNYKNFKKSQIDYANCCTNYKDIQKKINKIFFDNSVKLV